MCKTMTVRHHWCALLNMDMVMWSDCCCLILIVTQQSLIMYFTVTLIRIFNFNFWLSLRMVQRHWKSQCKREEMILDWCFMHQHQCWAEDHLRMHHWDERNPKQLQLNWDEQVRSHHIHNRWIIHHQEHSNWHHHHHQDQDIPVLNQINHHEINVP